MRNVLILTYWNFSDALIQAYTLPYVRIIRKKLSADSRIFLVTLEKKDLSAEEVSAITSTLRADGIEWIHFRYRRFGVAAFVMWALAFLKLVGVIITKRIAVIHCWCMPAGAIGYVLSVVTGRKLILDSYEPHAEAMLESGTWTKKSLAFRLLFWLEKKQTQRASVVIRTTPGMADYAKQKYGVTIKSTFVKPACVEVSFYPDTLVKDADLLKELGLSDKWICVYAGKFGDLYYEQEPFEFFKKAYDHWHGRFAVLLLTNQSRDAIDGYCQQAGLPTDAVVSRFVPHAEIPRYLSLADFAINPMKPIPSRLHCTPIKDGEYWAAGLPVVILPGISVDSDLINTENLGAVMKNFSPEECTNAIAKLERLLTSDRIALRKRIQSVAVRARGFQLAESVYQSIYG